MAGKVVAMETRLLAVFTAGLTAVNVSGLCAELSISRQPFYRYRRRYGVEGPPGLVERSRRPGSSPAQTPFDTEEAIVSLRKELEGEGFDHGASSIAHRLARGVGGGPTAKAPPFGSPPLRLAPPQRRLADRRHLVDVVIGARGLDHGPLRRPLPAGPGRLGRAWTHRSSCTFCVGAERFGLPAHVMSDNGPCFTARFRGGEAAFEGDLRALGIGHILSTPGHPPP